MDFNDTAIINRTRYFVDAMQEPTVSGLLTDAQQGKLATLDSLLTEVGDVEFDTEIDILIALMTEIRDR